MTVEKGRESNPLTTLTRASRATDPLRGTTSRGRSCRGGLRRSLLNHHKAIAKEGARPMTEQTHECVFVEEDEPSGRLILPPCIVCGCPAMDALNQIQRVSTAAEELAEEWARDPRPYGLSYRDASRRLRAVLDHGCTP